MALNRYRLRHLAEQGHPGASRAFELLKRPEFTELWVMKWAELLQIRSSENVSPKAMLLYYGWLEERIAGNVTNMPSNCS